MKAALALLLWPALSLGEESIRYTINWPSGLSLGEATLKSNFVGGAGSAELVLEAVVPGYPIRDEYRSSTSAGFCSTKFTKNSLHGKRKTSEVESFDPGGQKIVRQTVGGGRTEIASTQSPCPKDALAFLFFLRDELKQGRLPGSQTIYFGAGYQLRVAYSGAEQVTLEDQRIAADKLTASIKGPASDISFEAYFSRDGDRVPLIIRVPLAAGSFTMELVRQ
jgi:hypothetical protein